MDTLQFPLTLAGALGAGLNAGLFFVFSVAVMRALGRLPASQGIAAMQLINTTILNPVFFVVFFGTAAAAGLLAVLSLSSWTGPGAMYAFAGSLTYLVGGLSITAACNVPRNNALAAVEADDPASAELWARYLREWTAWNHVRTVMSLAAAALLSLAL